uniref:Uncharacterized protein n=1 Tax=Strigamia maritima TaxID=126957 RepID=T1J8Q8_STRMM
MRTFILFVVLGMAAAETCFDHNRIETDYKPLKAECKAEIHDEDAVVRMKKLTKCLITKKGWLHADGTFDFDAFEDESEKMLITTKKGEIMQIMKTCWDNSSDGDTKLAQFFGCYKPKVNENRIELIFVLKLNKYHICTDALQWED